MKRLIISIGLITCYIGIFAQPNYKHINSEEVISDGIDAYNQEEYQKAYDLYEQVHPGDTNYMRASYEKSLALLSLHRYDSTITLCNELLKLPFDEHNLTYNNLGTAYDGKGETQNAIDAYLKGLSHYPMSDDLHFNIAVTYQNNDQIDSAIFHYKEAIKINMFHASANVRLGLICANENQMTKAMLCLNMFLIVEPNSNRSLQVIDLFNEMLATNFKGEPKGVKTAEDGEDNFKDIDLIISNRLALNQSYKTPNKLDFAIVKQNYALIEALEQKSVSGFWNDSYVPFFKSIYTSNKFNGFIYYILQSSKNEKVRKLISQKNKEIDEFVDWAVPELIRDFSEYTIYYQGKKQAVSFTHSGNSLESVGIVKNDKKEGGWRYYHNSGALLAQGNFKEDLKEGNWNYYYSNGQLSSEEVYSNGKLIETDKGYYNNGNLESEFPYNSSVVTGTAKNFYNTGGLSSEVNYADSKKNGEATYYYEVGPVNYKVNYKDDELDGPFVEYYASGSKASEATYVLGKREGKRIIYYETGEIESEENYKNGLESGAFKSYFQNGTIKSESEYFEGKLINARTNYYSNGVLESEEIFDADGKQNGISYEYDRDGNKNQELDYRKGEIIGYRAYNSKGELLAEGKKKNKQFKFVNFYPNGILKTEGLYEIGEIGKVGVWKYYHSNGKLSQVENFENGELNGELKKFHKNGNIKTISHFKDGDFNGLLTDYRIDGTVERQLWLENDLKNGSYYAYYPDESINYHQFYVNGKRNGPQVFFDLNGKIQYINYYNEGIFVKHQDMDTNNVVINEFNIVFDSTEYSYHNFQGKPIWENFRKNNKLQGTTNHYYTDGTLSASGVYFNNNLYGTYTWYHRNGKISGKGNYRNEMRYGLFESFDESGNLIKKRNYYDDLLEGKYITYYSNGNIKFENTYIAGEDHGRANFYSPNGSLRHIRYYDYGTIIGYSYLGKDGEPVEMIPLENESGKIVSYFKNGNISITFEMINGLIEGKYEAYFENGNLYQTVVFENGNYTGNFEEYYPNGNMRTLTPYLNDDINGVKKYFRNDGTLEKEQTYKFDSLHGKTKYYNEKGELVKTEDYYNNYLVQ